MKRIFIFCATLAAIAACSLGAVATLGWACSEFVRAVYVAVAG